MLNDLQRWFDAQREALSARVRTVREQRQARRNAALWSTLNFDHGTRGLDQRILAAVRAGADVHAVVPDGQGYGRVGGQRPIVWAVNAERWNLVVPFLKHGADANSMGQPVLEWRVSPGQAQRAGSHRFDGDVPVLALALQKVAQAMADEAVPEEAHPPMWRAIDALLEHGADPLARTHGTTALDQVIMRTPHLKRWRLNEAGPLQRFQRLGINAADEDGRTPLHTMVRHGAYEHRQDIPGFRALLLAGADPYATDRAGRSPLHDLAEAVRCGDQHPHALDAINRQFPDLDWNRPDLDGQTPWDVMQAPESMARQDGLVYAGAMARLLAHRVDLDARTLRAVVDEVSLDVPASVAGPAPARPRSRL